MEVNLIVENGRALANSVDVAESFDRQHKTVIQAIKKLLDDLGSAEGGKEFGALNFEQSTYTDARGNTQPCYKMTRDGFTMLAMGFTGEKATRFKMAYIDAFNRMEAQLAPRLTTAQVLPEIMRPVMDANYITILRDGYNALIDLVRVCNQLITEGRGYLLPDGVPYREIPGMAFLGWYDNNRYEISPDAIIALGFKIPYSAYTTVSHVHLKQTGLEELKFFTIERTIDAARLNARN